MSKMVILRFVCAFLGTCLFSLNTSKATGFVLVSLFIFSAIAVAFSNCRESRISIEL